MSALRALGFGFVLLALGCLALAWSFAGFVAQIEQAETPPRRHADGAVALTGGADRITDAVELLAKGNADRLLITGVNPMTSRLDLARKVPQAGAWFGCCIELGYEAANTIGNAAETERWARAHHMRSLIVVTSNYHMPRALAEIGFALPDVDLQAFPVVTEHGRTHAWWNDTGSARLIVSEYVKYVAARLRLGLSSPRAAATHEAAAR